MLSDGMVSARRRLLTASSQPRRPAGWSNAARHRIGGTPLLSPWIVSSLALSVRRRLLAAGGVDSVQAARPGRRGAGCRKAFAGAIPPAVPDLVHAGLAGLCGRDRDLRADDRQAAAVVAVHASHGVNYRKYRCTKIDGLACRGAPDRHCRRRGQCHSALPKRLTIG